MERPTEMILTAGPSIGQKEIDYVRDAVENGWNFHFRDYIDRFEKALATYNNRTHALMTSSGTGALHVGLALLAVGPGDEVILPDMTFIACANAIEYLGAKPVFVDVDPRTWCIDVKSTEEAITPRTKAIMPVWMYGNAPDADSIAEIAKRHDSIYVLQDVCPALGTLYKSRQAGSLGDMAALSFQGAKIAVMGEGGALLLDNEEMYKRAMSLYSHGRSPIKQFWADEKGYMYRQNNVSAALGLAQLERIEEFVAKKRKIFAWYYERLSDIPWLSLNCELPDVRSNMWMSSIILHEDAPVKREELREELYKRMVDTRPFFYPITMFPMYKHLKVDNPNAYKIGLSGINLPSGVMLTEEIVDYVCEQIRIILKGGR